MNMASWLRKKGRPNIPTFPTGISGSASVCAKSLKTAAIFWIRMWSIWQPEDILPSLDGSHLVGAEGKLDYHQPPNFSHTLYSDYYWYEIGDVIGIGDNEFSYFCFPKENVSVTKARLATEELYKMKKEVRV